MYIISKYNKEVSNNVRCSTVNKRKCFYTWGTPLSFFNCNHQTSETHVCDDECCKQCLFKLDPEHIQVETRPSPNKRK